MPQTALKGKNKKFLLKADSVYLQSETILKNVLLEIVKKIGMTALGNPHIYNVSKTLAEQKQQSEFVDTGGITGVIVLSTSHVAIHTWPETNEAVCDAYSCKEYDIDIPISIIKNNFMATNILIRDFSPYLYWL